MNPAQPNPGGGPRSVVYWRPGQTCQNDQWERAYARFETPQQELAKFLRRLRRLGVDSWPKGLRMVELFCGRGNGLKAQQRLGFTALEGVDLSPTLLGQYDGPAGLYVGDCRELGFDDASKDVVVVQGGLHHLPRLPEDLEKVLGEVHRVLAPEGRLVIVEPWWTPFLRVVHLCCRLRLLRRLWPKFDACARMIELEGQTYLDWLESGPMIEQLLGRYFQNLHRHVAWGKFLYVGRRRAGVVAAGGGPAAAAS